MCIAVAPGRFRLVRGIAEPEPGEVPVGDQAAVHAAAALCPAGAIDLDDPNVDPTCR
jgi:ferredoxin